MNAISSLLRSAIVLILALAGVAMAFVLMISTAIAIAVLYVVAKVRGKPFGPAQFWNARRGMQWQFVHARTGSPARAAPKAGQAPQRPVRHDNTIIDVEAREIR